MNVQTSHSDLASHVTATTGGVADLSAIDRFQGLGGSVAAIADGMINRQAAMIAYIDNFYAMMWLTILTAPFVLLMRKPKGMPGRR